MVLSFLSNYFSQKNFIMVKGELSEKTGISVTWINIKNCTLSVFVCNTGKKAQKPPIYVYSASGGKSFSPKNSVSSPSNSSSPL